LDGRVVARARAHLLIDGYNLIHQLPELASLFAESREAAVDALVRMARTIHDGENIRVTVVFDGSSRHLQVETPCGRDTFSVVYAPAHLTADGVLEQMLARSSHPERFTVASRDNMIREVAASRGAFLLSGEQLSAWVDRCERGVRDKLGSRPQASWGNRLGAALDAAVVPPGPTARKR